VARQHGLDGRAARLLVGETVEELEGSAAALQELLRERAEDERGPAAPSPDPSTAAAAAKAERRQTLLAALTGRAPQRRDERGRFTGFDGGARSAVPASPESHEATLTRLLRTGEANAGRGL
jgi:hypothetical protein